MKILICNERFIFRYGVDRVLLILGDIWKRNGHEIIMMGNHYDEDTVNRCANSFIKIPEYADYNYANQMTVSYLQDNWSKWFSAYDEPDFVLVAGWPFYDAIEFFEKKGLACVACDFGGVPEESTENSIQHVLRSMRKKNYPKADKIIAISKFIEETQSKLDGNKTNYIHLGADHMDMDLWGKEDGTDNSIIEEIKDLKKDGYRIIFQPGRWEINNYKSSEESIDIIRGLIEKGNKKIKYLVLSTFEKMDIPSDLREYYYPLGFINDLTMKEIMSISDLGILPSKWEGFDLPLAEMQYLKTPVLSYNIGAHPEVSCHKYFLCENIEEMINKADLILSNKMELAEEEYEKVIVEFKNNFTWNNCATKMMKEFSDILKEKPILLMDVSFAAIDLANAGISRTTRKLARYLQEKMKTVFVIWDEAHNKFVLPNQKEIDVLSKFNGPIANDITLYSPKIRRVSLDEILDLFNNRKKIYFMVGTGITERMNTYLSYLDENNIMTAAIFHDAIPITHPKLTSKEISDNHIGYVKSLSKFDYVFPTAEHNANDLKMLWEEYGLEASRVEVAPLAVEVDGVKRNIEKVNKFPEGKKKILFVSTLEPRKNHKRFLEALDILFSDYPDIENQIEINIVGKPFEGDMTIYEKVKEYAESHECINYLGVVDEDDLQSLMAESTFTVYPSLIEGFGMPIFESLWYGKPCLCNMNGSIGALAKDGGCAMVDVMNPSEIASSLYKLISDENYYVNLQNEAVERDITTWKEYSDNIYNSFINNKKHNYRSLEIEISEEIKKKLEDYVSEDSLKVVMVSNYYPPNVLGGAEIICSKQAEALLNEQLAKPIVFTVNPYNESPVNEIVLYEHNGIPVISLSVPISNYYTNNISFFNSKVNEAFEKLCDIYKPDRVHVHHITNGMSFGLLEIAKKYGAKVIQTVHDTGYLCHKGTCLDNEGNYCEDFYNCEKCLEAFYYDNNICVPIGMRKNYVRRMLENVDGFVFPSQDMMNRFIRFGFNKQKMKVIYNGIDVNGFEVKQKYETGIVNITFIGYLGKHKGIYTLIDAISLIDNQNIHLIIVGDGGEKDNLLAYCAKKQLDGKVSFLGRVERNKIGEVYKESDIFVMPSICPENSPVTIAEAMASGICVIGSNIGGIPELIKDGENGYLFSPGNVDELKERLIALINDDELRVKMGKVGRKMIENKSFQHTAQEIINYYNNISYSPIKSSKSIIAFVGKKVPLYINKISRHDIFLEEWLINEDDYKDVKLIVCGENEKLNNYSMEMIYKYNIPVYVHASNIEYQDDLGDNFHRYNEIDEYLKAIIEIN